MDGHGFHIDSDGHFSDWPRRPMIPSVNIMYFAATAGIILMQLLIAVIIQIAPWLSRAWVFCAMSVLYYLGTSVLPVTHYALEHPGAARGMRFKRPPLYGLVIAVPAALVGVMLASNVGTLWLLGIEALGGHLTERTTLCAQLPLYAQLLVVALLPGICEEVLFRGAMLSAWERYGTRRALTVSTLLFVSLHGSIEGLPVQLMLGLALGVIVVATDSVVTGMLYHALHNALVILLSGLGGGGAPVAGEKLYDYLGGAPEVWNTALRTLTLGAVYAGLIAAMCYIGARKPNPSPPVGARSPMPPWAIVVLAAGIVTCACQYLINLLSIIGVKL